MLEQLTIRQRIMLTFIVVVLSGSIVQLFVAGLQLQSATIEFYQHHLETDAVLVASSLSEPMEYYLEGEGTGTLDTVVTNLSDGVVRDFLIVDRDFNVLTPDTNHIFASIDKLPSVPEIQHANSDQIGSDIRSDASGIERLYVAATILYDRDILGYLILSRPMQPAYDEVTQRWMQLAAATLAVMVLVIVASLWISSTISRPIRGLRNSALKMAQGNLHTRIKVETHDEIGQLAQSFNFMAEQIEALMQTQRSFVSNAAHELRTPLMTLSLRVEALEDDALSPDERQTYLSEAQQELKHMSALVTSLLILARIDEGRQADMSKISDTTATINDIARQARITAQQANLNFEADIMANLPDIAISSNSLRLILDNLIGNAVKYTKTGKIHLKAAQVGKELMLQVTDTGVGFQPEQQEQLFQRFYRAETVRSQFQGTGLGLSIVKTLVEQYGGHVQAESSGEGQGATFSVFVPFQPILSNDD